MEMVATAINMLNGHDLNAPMAAVGNIEAHVLSLGNISAHGWVHGVDDCCQQVGRY